jgi:hypothetical protein
MARKEGKVLKMRSKVDREGERHEGRGVILPTQFHSQLQFPSTEIFQIDIR